MIEMFVSLSIHGAVPSRILLAESTPGSVASNQPTAQNKQKDDDRNDRASNWTCSWTGIEGLATVMRFI